MNSQCLGLSNPIPLQSMKRASRRLLHPVYRPSPQVCLHCQRHVTILKKTLTVVIDVEALADMKTSLQRGG